MNENDVPVIGIPFALRHALGPLGYVCLLLMLGFTVYAFVELRRAARASADGIPPRGVILCFMPLVAASLGLYSGCFSFYHFYHYHTGVGGSMVIPYYFGPQRVFYLGGWLSTALCLSFLYAINRRKRS